MRSIALFLIFFMLAVPLAAQDFVWTGWEGGPDTTPAWGLNWSPEWGYLSNGWGHTWFYTDDETQHYPGESSWVLIPDGVALDILSGVPARCGDLSIAPTASLNLPASGLSIHGPTLDNGGQVVAYGISGMANAIELFGALDIVGTGEISLSSAQIYSWNPEVGLDIGAGQVIHGAGSIGFEPYGNYHGVAIANHGVIRASDSVNPFDLRGTTCRNDGTIAASNEGVMRIRGSWDNTGGEFLASGDAVVRFCDHVDHPARIDGGVLRTTENGQFQGTSNTSVKNVTLDGLLHIQRHTTLHMADTITNLGVINQGFYDGAGPATLYVDSALTFAGDGELQLGMANAIKMYQFPDHNAVLTNGPDHTIISHGGYIGENPDYYGDQRLELVNEGTIVCQDSPYRNEFRLAGSGFINRGTLVIEPSETQTTFLWGGFEQTAGRLECDDVFQAQSGTFAFSGGVLAGAGGLQGHTAVGGEAVIHPGDQGEIGTLDIWGDLTLNDGATLVCEWAHNQKDRLAVHGAVAATGSIRLRVEFLEIDPGKAADYTLLTCDDLDDQATWTVELPEGWSCDGVAWVDGELVVQGMTGMPTDAPGLPTPLALHGAAPNPFNPTTSVRYALDHDGPVRLWVSDVAGRRVRTLIDGVGTAGEHSVIWDGRDTSGRGVGSGTYLCVLEASGERRIRRMSLVR